VKINVDDKLEEEREGIDKEKKETTLKKEQKIRPMERKKRGPQISIKSVIENSDFLCVIFMCCACFNL
jgi:hypothetical protein